MSNKTNIKLLLGLTAILGLFLAGFLGFLIPAIIFTIETGVFSGLFVGAIVFFVLTGIAIVFAIWVLTWDSQLPS